MSTATHILSVANPTAKSFPAPISPPAMSPVEPVSSDVNASNGVGENINQTDTGTDEVTADPAKMVEELKEEADSPEASARAARLSFLLDKSTIYAKIIGDRMARQQIEKRKAEARAEVRKQNKEKKVAETKEKEVKVNGGGGKRESRRKVPAAEEGIDEVQEDGRGKRKRQSLGGREQKKAKAEEGEMEVDPSPAEETKLEGDADADAGAEAVDEEDNVQYSFKQPELVTGAKLRDYQLAGVQWMISLYENGLNGILADEMGLGKTLQTISFLAHLRSKGTWGPFLIVCPLSVLNNWVMEFEKFCPTIPVVMYHGTPDHRSELRATRLQPPSSSGAGYIPGTKKGARKSTSNKNEAADTMSFPIVVTTYEICMKDKQWLSGLKWKFVVVDEGHRLKNLDCKLIRELKSYNSANRMILTGTPLHNNLSELWSLLNFILPDIFDDLDAFQQWFDLSSSSSDDPDTVSGLLDKSNVVASLHAILKPFLLRRLKVDVEKDLPPKKEYLLYAPLTQSQKDIYQAIASGQIREYLIDKVSGSNVNSGSSTPDPAIVELETGRGQRKKGKKVNYKIEENDNKYIRDLENGKIWADDRVEEKSAADVGKEWALKHATKHVNNMRLQNIIMQLRKISSHPFLFDWPSDPKTGDLVVDENLVNASGKMLLLNRLLDALFSKGHRVLLFSQFTTMLDVIEDWATIYKGWEIKRIDGSTSQESRREQMNEFNAGKDDPDACKLFLLSTRAGGLGINLVSADTVIFFDQDWNPQMDLQAQDRAHRIGQTKPVLVFRLVSAHTIESKILAKAGDKRKLEALVITQGKFGRVVDETGKVLLGRGGAGGKAGKGKDGKESVAEMARALLELEGEEINVASKDDQIISDADLEILLDRSPAAFARQKGWSTGLSSTARKERSKKGEKAMFEVFESEKDNGEGLGGMFNGAEEEG